MLFACLFEKHFPQTHLGVRCLRAASKTSVVLSEAWGKEEMSDVVGRAPSSVSSSAKHLANSGPYNIHSGNKIH